MKYILTLHYEPFYYQYLTRLKYILYLEILIALFFLTQSLCQNILLHTYFSNEQEYA